MDTKIKVFIIICLFLVSSLLPLMMIGAVTSTPSPISSATPTPKPGPTQSPIQSISPTSSPASTSCQGKVEMNTRATRRINFGEEDNEENIAAKLKEMFIEVSNNQQFLDFQICKYPPTFSCPPECDVLVDNKPYLYLLPPIIITSEFPKPSYNKEGEFKKWVSLASLASVGIGFQDAPDLVMPDLMKELNKIVESINKANPCPKGKARFIQIQLLSIETNPAYLLGILTGYDVKASYAVYVYCLDPAPNPTYCDMRLSILSAKHCIPK